MGTYTFQKNAWFSYSGQETTAWLTLQHWVGVDEGASSGPGYFGAAGSQVAALCPRG